jgi:hypothetical protein
MRGVIINELDIFNRAIKNNELSDKPLETLRILAKGYFKDGMDKEQILDKLHNFMSRNYAGYKQTKWQKILEDLIKGVSKYESFELLDIKSILITKDEWDIILALDNKLLERLAFIMLIYQKINIIKNPNSNGWINNCISDIFREAKVGYTGDEQKKLLYKLYEKKYILMKNVCDGNSIKINYINIESKEFIHIYNFENVISYYYEYKNNEVWKECNICRKRFKPKSKNSPQKYCNKHQKEVGLEKHKERNKKWYKNKISDGK